LKFHRKGNCQKTKVFLFRSLLQKNYTRKHTLLAYNEVSTEEDTHTDHSNSDHFILLKKKASDPLLRSPRESLSKAALGRKKKFNLEPEKRHQTDFDGQGGKKHCVYWEGNCRWPHLLEKKKGTASRKKKGICCEARDHNSNRKNDRPNYAHYLEKRGEANKRREGIRGYELGEEKKQIPRNTRGSILEFIGSEREKR